MISYFLGANSPKGFYSLYDELMDRSEANAVYILKGGPGCGKSTLMKKVGVAAEQAGFPVEYIRCSGDPDSLDGVILPRQKTAIVDGTAPHVVEPKLPGAVDHYINLEECYDTAALLPLREELSAVTAGYKGCYDRAYRCLAAASDVQKNIHAGLEDISRQDKLAKRAQGIISRELRGKGVGTGKVTRRFLSAISCNGLLALWETAESYKKVYVLEDSFGFAHRFLCAVLTAATAAGQDVVACPSPMDPERLEHLLIPALSLAFVTSSPVLPYPGKAYRRIRLDAMLQSEPLRQLRPRLRFSGKMVEALLKEGIHCLKEAKALHDQLEAIYNPHVDFDRVDTIAATLISRLGLV